MQSWEIRIQGIVQGVGFRPYVYKSAVKSGIKGTVSNGVAGVIIQFNAEKEKAKAFHQQILTDKPSKAYISHSSFQAIGDKIFDNFQIIDSQVDGVPRLMLTPDYGICPTCRMELHDPENRRSDYPFITCTQCGPRYSIIEALPYDRPLTAMSEFGMCSDCKSEYENPLDRRYYSQTNSCPNCAIKLSLIGADEGKIEGDVLDEVLTNWDEGKIIAIKGIGGFLFTCNASDERVVEELRKRKQRPSKPFALMYPLHKVESDLKLEKWQREVLLDSVSPILLVNSPAEGLLADNIAKGLNQIGVMLPYAPLFEWLLSSYQKPIVATSANISHSPIIYQDEEAKLLQTADFVLTHNRKILIPQDDSVLRYSSSRRQKIILRRSRGLAPNYFPGKEGFSDKQILATGADMKASFGLLHEGNVYVSQYLGDLSHFDTYQSYQKVLQHMLSVLDSKPELVLHDLHPNYASSRMAIEFAAIKGITTIPYQHHKAHFAAVLAENELLEQDVPVLGVIWDGTGYGEDGNIWGGEFFVFQAQHIQRVGHIPYFTVLAGDKMAKEPRLSALSLSQDQGIIRQKFSEQELKIYDLLLKKNTVQCASMGRIFDAVASVLAIADYQSYEGEAAMILEAMAQQYFKTKADTSLTPFDLGSDPMSPDIRHLINQIITEMKLGREKDEIAARFHVSLVHMVKSIANNLKIKQIAFSGGVFQNALLVDLLINGLEAEHQLYFHKQLSPNDENIAFGQIVMYHLQHYKN